MLVALYGLPRHSPLLAAEGGFASIGHETKWRRHSAFNRGDYESEFDAVCVYGLRGPNEHIRDAYVGNDRKVVVFDSGHLKRGAGYHKVALNSHHWVPPFACPADRLEKLNIEVAKASKRSGYALILGQLPGDSQHGFNAKTLDTMYSKWIAELKERGFEVRFRAHPRAKMVIDGVASSDPDKTTLAEDFSGAQIAVTYNSTAGLEALIAGIPVVAFGDACYSDIASSSFDHLSIDEAKREQALRRIAYTQWTLDEIASGEALKIVLGEHIPVLVAAVPEPEKKLLEEPSPLPRRRTTAKKVEATKTPRKRGRPRKIRDQSK